MNKKKINTAAPALLDLDISDLRWDKETWEELLECFSKDELVRAWFPYVKEFFTETPEGRWGELSTRGIFTQFNPNQGAPKEVVFLFTFAVLKNRDIFTDFLNFLPRAAQKALLFAAWTPYFDRAQLERELGISILDDEEEHMLREVQLLKIKGRYGSWNLRMVRHGRWSRADAEFSLPEPVREILQEYVDKPNGYYITPSPEIKFAEEVQLFSAEQCIFKELPLLLTWHQQGKFKYNLHGKPDLANIKKVAKTLHIEEFYPETPALPTRTNMLVGILYEYAENKAHLEEVIKVLFQEHFSWLLKNSSYSQTNAPLYLYNYLKGLGGIDKMDLNGNYNVYLTKLLSELPVGEWVTRENYIRHLAFHSVPVEPFRFSREYRLFYNRKDEHYDYNHREKVNAGNVQHLIILPYILGLIFMLASLGMAEVAYQKVNTNSNFGTEWFSEYDGLEAFRLTPLGAYALGITDSYEAPVTLATNKFIFEEDALMLRVEGDLSIIDVMLEQFLEKTSANRYAFNTGLFLGDCKTPHDIEVKINLFKQTINTPLPQFWQNYLDTLLENTKSIQQKQDVVIYQIDAANKDLQRLMAQDAVLKSLILKAEQFLVIVPTTNMSRFQSRMKELGYLVERKSR